MVPEDVALFGREVSAQLLTILGSDLVGAYFVGSVALGGYVAGESDIDILAVAAGTVLPELKARIADGLLRSALACPARGLEFNLYRREVLLQPPEGADFELSINGGPRMERKVVFDPVAEAPFWYVLDRAVAHCSGIAVVGPPAAAVIGDIARPTLLGMMAESMRWHRVHEKATLYSVLNAARAWRFAAENVLGSKLDGAAWARERWADPETVDAAVQLRHGGGAQLDPGRVDEFLAHVEATLLNNT